MLYDTKWNAKADPLSLQGLIAWLETKPAKGTYNWRDCGGSCLVDRYGKAMLGHKLACEPGDLELIFGSMLEYQKVGGGKPWTFGAALKRARELANAV